MHSFVAVIKYLLLNGFVPQLWFLLSKFCHCVFPLGAKQFCRGNYSFMIITEGLKFTDDNLNSRDLKGALDELSKSR